jgi:hypothetical protein
MDTPTFASLMVEERTRIQDAIKAAKAKRQEAEREIAQLEAQSAAIVAYDAALKGTSVPKEPGGRRGRSGHKREGILARIAEHPDGMTRAELIASMQAHGDKAAVESISNALAALKKAGRLTQEGKTYKVVE